MVWARGRHWLAAVALLMWAGAMLGACRPSEEAAKPTPAGVVKRYGAPPLTLELRLDRERLTMAERLTVELRAETDEGHAVKFSEAKEFAGFAVAAVNETKPELTAAGRVVVSSHYVLEPLAVGPVQIPALTVEAWQKAEANAPVTTVATEPVSVLVESLLAQGDAGDAISDIAPPLAQPLNRWLLAGLGLAGVLAVALVVYVVRRRQRRIVPPPPPLPPHLLAYQALDRLLATDLLDTHQIKAFYESLSAILRHYIEQRFGLKAPEQTTEEFLTELGRVGSAGGGQLCSSIVATTSHQLLLRDFLSHCDLVKFARHTPARSEAEESVERCRCFIRETEPVVGLETEPGAKA